MNPHDEPQRPWYKNHILLLCIIIPLLTVVGGFTTLYLALSSNESPVFESYEKQGVIPGKRSLYANDIDLSATLDTSKVVLTLHTQPPLDEPLQIKLEHATRANEDQMHVLQAFAPNVYPLSDKLVKALAENKWYVKVHPLNHPTWELQGVCDARHQKKAQTFNLTLHR